MKPIRVKTQAEADNDLLLGAFGVLVAILVAVALLMPVFRWLDAGFVKDAPIAHMLASWGVTFAVVAGVPFWLARRFLRFLRK